MRVLLAIAAGLSLFLAPASGQTGSAQPPASPGSIKSTPSAGTPEPPAQPCSGRNAKECGVSREDFRKAQQAFHQGQELQQKEPEQALSAYQEAAQLVPRNVAYARAHEMLRQQIVYDHVQRGNELAQQKLPVESAMEFRKALELDPGNQFAVQRLRDVANAPAAPPPSFIEPSLEEQEILLQPQPGRQTLHLSGDLRGAYTQVGTAFKIKVAFDDSTAGKPVRMDLDKVTFAQAMNAIALVTRTFWAPVSSREILVAPNTSAKHKELDRWVLRTFYLPEVSSPQELNDIVNLLRTLFELKHVVPAPANSSISLRGPAPVVQAATRLLQTLWTGRPQVMLDVEVYQVTRSMLRNVGVDLPLQFNVFNIPESVIAALQNSNIQQLIAASGASNATIAALLAQAGLEQFAALLQNPIATFGGGISFMGVSIPPLTANFSASESRVMALQKVSMRALQGNAATFRFGTRYPVLNASYSSAVSLPSSALAGLPSQVSNLLGGSGNTGNSLATFPSFSYEDLGITLKAKPSIHAGREVTLDLEMELRSLGAQVFNSIPTINNRSYKGVITLKDGEPAVIAGALSKTERDSMSGIPGLSRVPGLGMLTGDHTKERDEDELLLLITPHIISAGPGGHGPAIPMPKSE